MLFTTLSAASLVALVAVQDVAAHAAGSNGFRFSRGRRVIQGSFEDVRIKRTPNLQNEKRAATCGIDYGKKSCPAGQCCSEWGECGTGIDYCSAPDCQFQYGPACDANTVPAGATTYSGGSRTLPGSVLYGGAGIYDCKVAGTVALTFDDGPYIYTAGMLAVLQNHNAKATFFITGNNIGKGRIDDTTKPWPQLIKDMYAAGHQIASHTWSHQDLSAITAAQRQNQMVYNEMALRNILGFYPTYMRPPYSSCNSACATQLKTLGYHISYFDVDTDDYNQDTPALIQNSKNWFKGNISAGNPATDEWLTIAHDIHEQTAQNLTEFMLTTLEGLGYRAVTMGECMGDPVANWYRTPAPGTSSSTPAVPSSTISTSTSSSQTSSSSAAPSSTISTSTSSSRTSTSSAAAATKTISPDATCGTQSGNKYTCQGSTFGNCCSVNGWCGSTNAYCGTGCQVGFGSCGTVSISSTPTSSATGTSTALVISTDGDCGGTGKKTCKGSTFGNCCSQYGWCGATSAYCGTGCQATYGTCT